MNRALRKFLQSRSPLVEEGVEWPGRGLTMVQTRSTYALERTAPPLLKLVTSVRALLARGSEIMVVRDPDGCHIIPGGRPSDGEGLSDALKRELLEETGWSAQCEPAPFAVFHYHIHSSRPEGYPYPYPDYLQPIYCAKAGSYFPEAREVGGFELDSAFHPRFNVEQMPLSEGETALLELLDPF